MKDRTELIQAFQGFMADLLDRKYTYSYIRGSSDSLGTGDPMVMEWKLGSSYGWFSSTLRRHKLHNFGFEWLALTSKNIARLIHPGGDIEVGTTVTVDGPAFVKERSPLPVVVSGKGVVIEVRKYDYIVMLDGIYQKDEVVSVQHQYVRRSSHLSLDNSTVEAFRKGQVVDLLDITVEHNEEGVKLIDSSGNNVFIDPLDLEDLAYLLRVKGEGK